MLKEKKLEYQKGLEEYMEEQKLYELFEGMMKGLIMEKPTDPVEFLIQQLQSQESKFLLDAAMLKKRFLIILNISPPNRADWTSRKQEEGDCSDFG